MHIKVTRGFRGLVAGMVYHVMGSYEQGLYVTNKSGDHVEFEKHRGWKWVDHYLVCLAHQSYVNIYCNELKVRGTECIGVDGTVIDFGSNITTIQKQVGGKTTYRYICISCGCNDVADQRFGETWGYKCETCALGNVFGLTEDALDKIASVGMQAYDIIDRVTSNNWKLGERRVSLFTNHVVLQAQIIEGECGRELWLRVTEEKLVDEVGTTAAVWLKVKKNPNTSDQKKWVVTL